MYILVCKQLFLLLTTYTLVCFLYVMAVQSKTHKGEFVIIFFICRDLLSCLWNTYAHNTYHYLTYETVNCSSNSIKTNSNLHLPFWKKLIQSSYGHTSNFKLTYSSSYNLAAPTSRVLIGQHLIAKCSPCYLSVYDYV